MTVHRVDEGVDTGPILAQTALPVNDGAGSREVRRRSAPLECALLTEVVQGIAVGRDLIGPSAGGRRSAPDVVRYPSASANHTMPMAMRPIGMRRARVAASPKNTMPAMAAPTAPVPVHTA